MNEIKAFSNLFFHLKPYDDPRAMLSACLLNLVLEEKRKIG
jgi:hypothetical protein